MGEVDSQLEQLDPALRPAVQRAYDRARELVPGMDQGVSYGMAALRHRGRPLIAVVPRKAGLTIYPFSGKVTAVARALAEGYDGTSGCIRFSPERPLPDAAVDALIMGRRAEIDEALDRPRRGSA